jgi:DNA-binding transcriptional ArsR family regulator
MNNKIKKENIELLAKKLRVAGDSSRLRIMCFIFNNKNVCVSDIAKNLKMSVAITSHHLQSLAKEDLLESNRDGKKICYSLSKNSLVLDLKKFICRYK